MIQRIFTTSALYVAVAAATILVPTTDAQAGVIPWVYDVVFGSTQSTYSGYSTYYRPSYSYYSPYRSNYGTPLSGWHRPAAYSTVQYAAPGCSTCKAACPGGNCGLTTTAGKPTPVKDEISDNKDEKKTFAEKPEGGAEPAANSGFHKTEKQPLKFAGEATDGDAEVETRLSALEAGNKSLSDTNTLILKQLEELSTTLEGLKTLNEKVDALNELKTKVESLEADWKKARDEKSEAPKADDDKKASASAGASTTITPEGEKTVTPLPPVNP